MLVEVKLPVEFASADAIQRALYRIANVGTWDIAQDGGFWLVKIAPNEGVDPKQLEADFKQHVVDYGLREKIRSETEQVRALLLAHAFSGVSRHD